MARVSERLERGWAVERFGRLATTMYRYRSRGPLTYVRW